MISRRTFLRNTAVSAALAPVAAQCLSISCTGHKKLQHYGFISGIIGKELKDDWRGTLKKTFEMGYTEFEGEVEGVTPREFRNYCDDIGLKPVATGI